MQPKSIAMSVALLPMITIAAAYLVSITSNLVPACIPFVEGCTSISRAARDGYAIFIFRPGMIITAVLLVAYWKLTLVWFGQLGSQQKNIDRTMFILGTIGAIFLVLYSDFLGADGAVYRLLRRHGINLFFSCSLLAQFIQLRQQLLLARTNERIIIRENIISFQYALAGLILLLGLTSVILRLALLNSDRTENILEWNVTLCILLFFLGNYFFWKDNGFEIQFALAKHSHHKKKSSKPKLISK